MNVRWIHRLTALAGLGALTAALFTPSCVDNESTFFVEGVQTLSDDCVGQQDELVALGIIDTALTTSYAASLQVASQLVPRGDETRNRTESGIVLMYEAEVRVEGLAGTLSEFTWPVAGVLNSNGVGNARARASAGVLLIDEVAAQAATPGEIVLANVIIHGRSTGGYEVETPEFAFPIQTCVGCLVVCPMDDPDVAGICDAPVDSEGNRCLIGQDDRSAGCNEIANGDAFCTAP
jgi:hypothetical protein